MVKKKGKPSKQTKKREPWLVEDVRVHTALPPQVEGQLRCFCRLSISQIIWVTAVTPDLTLVRIKWWGEPGDGSIFKPLNVKKGDKSGCQTTARYPVRSGPRQFAAYLSDMGALTLEVMSGQLAAPIGQAEVPQIGLLSVNRPINGFFPVFSPNEEKLAEIQVSVVLEPLMVSYDSMGSIPTSDISLETHTTQESTYPHRYQPRPHFSQPVMPQEDPFVSPASHLDADGQKKENGLSLPYAADVKQRLRYDAVDTQPVQEGSTVSITAGGQVVTTSESQGTQLKSLSPTHSRVTSRPGAAVTSAGAPSSNVLSVLLERGKKLRDAMAVSSVDCQDHHKMDAAGIRPQDIVVPEAKSINRSSSTGSLLKEILRAEKDAAGVAMATDDMMASDINSKTVDMVVGSPLHKNDFKMFQLLNGGSPGTSVSSDPADLSETGDPVQEDNILQELFYRHSESDGSVLSEMSGDERDKSVNTSTVSMEDPANVRPPSRRSSLSSLSLQFPEEEKKKPKRSTSKTRKKLRTREKNKGCKVQRSRSSSRSRSRTRTCAKLRQRASSASDASDNDVPSTPRSEVSRVSFDMTPSDVDEPVQDNPRSKTVDGLSVERLTLLGRVHVARVSVYSLTLHTDQDTSLVSNHSTKTNKGKRKGKPPRPTSKSKKPCTYFIEYQFPVVATSRDKYSPNTMATEVMRVASKNIKNNVVTFSHRSVFPIMFDGSSIEKWWKSALVFKVFSREAGQKIPAPVGSCGVSLKSILKSDSLCSDRQLEVRESSRNTSLNSSLRHNSLCGVFGHLKTVVELASDHREFATALAKTKLVEMSGRAKIVPIPEPAPPSSQTAGSLNSLPPPPFVVQTRHADFPAHSLSSQDSQPMPSLQAQSSNHVSQHFNDNTSSIAQTSSVNHLQQLHSVPSQAVSQPNTNNQPEPLTLHMMLMVPNGQNLSLQGVPPLHLVNRRPMLLQQPPPTSGPGARDLSTRNSYLVCRMFWCNDAVHSTVCWGTLQPQFNFLQVAPVLLSPALLERMRNNFLVIEVWDKTTAAGDDKLIGMVKLSLHQFYMSFRDRRVANALLKSQYPVIAADNYFGITDPFTSFNFGQLRLVLAMGSAEQIASLQRVKQDGDGSVMIPERPLHSLERHDLAARDDVNGHHPATDSAVEHVFEVVIEAIRDLKLFDNMMWGETDCFIQYHFPAQAQTKPLSDVRSIAPTMKCYRTATTLCTPDPTFHDCTRHKLHLPQGTPVQRELLTACANSGGGAGGLPFEVWCRYYHPNIREQVIAKATLPLAKLCAMVTMQKRGEPAIQSFSLPLSQVATESQLEDPESKAKVKDSGLMDVTVNYKAKTLKTEAASVGQQAILTGSQVCVSVGVIRATGLKCAAEKVCDLDPGMQYASEVGVNAYVRIKLSFLTNEGERITKTVARTFSPEFSHYLDFPCPLLWTDSKNDGTSLAELLETGEATFEVWHQVPGLHGGTVGQYVPTGTEAVIGRCVVQKTGDVLLGTTTLKLASLLTHRTGLLGWHLVTTPPSGWRKSEDGEGCVQQGLQQVGGGLEISIRFAHQEDREKVIHAGQSVGWSPALVGMEEEEDWGTEDEVSPARCYQMMMSVQDVCFPVHNALLTGHTQLEPSAKCYVRYKFYDKVAVSTKLSVLQQNEDGYASATFRHKHCFVVPRSSPFHWYLREERLEVQVWVSYGSSRDRQSRPHHRDKLVGSAYIELGSLADTSRKQHRLSGVYAVLKPGAASLGGACVHTQLTSKLLSRGITEALQDDEDMVENGLSEDDCDTEDSFHHLTTGSSHKVKDKFLYSPDNSSPRFAVHVFIERAMHLPRVTEKNKCGDSEPSTYVSYQTAEKSAPSCTAIFPKSSNPVWEHEDHTHLSTELLYQESKNLVLKVWHKPAEAAKQPDKSSDRVLGFVSVDLAPLSSGLLQICGWYNILDFTGQCKGQIKVSIVPDEPLGQSLQPDGVPSQTSLPSHVSSSFHRVPSLHLQPTSLPASLPRLQEHMASIRQQLQQRQADTPPVANAQHWQPRFPDLPDPAQDTSKSYLFTSLRKQLEDLDSITARLKEKLGPDSAANGERQPVRASGMVLTGTFAGLSTIHSVSSQGDAMENIEKDIAVSHSSNIEENVAASRSSNIAADSGAYSVENSSENTGADSQRSERASVFTTPPNPGSSNNGSDSGVNKDTSLTLRTPREWLDSNGVDRPQVLGTSAKDLTNNSDRLVFTEGGDAMGEFLMTVDTPRDVLTNYETSQGFVPGQMLPSPSQGSTEPRSHTRSRVEQDIQESIQELDSDQDEGEQFGNYHCYREMLDSEELEADDEGEGVEIVHPRRINDVSGILAGFYSGQTGDTDGRLVSNGQSQGFDKPRYEAAQTVATDDETVHKTHLGQPGSRQVQQTFTQHCERHDTENSETKQRKRTLVDCWLSETDDVGGEGGETPQEVSDMEDIDEATPRKMPPARAGHNTSTLLSNVELLDTLTSTLETREQSGEELEQPRRPHSQRLLSNVDLESVTSYNTSHRPDSGSSKISGRSSHLSSNRKDEDIVEDTAEGDLEWTGDERRERFDAVRQELDDFFSRQKETDGTLEDSSFPALKHLSLSGDLSTHSSGQNLHHTIRHVQQGYDTNTDLHSDRTTEDSGLESGTKSSQDEKEAFSMFDITHRTDPMPNFFLPPENLQASMRALQAATAAATQMTQDPGQAAERVQATSQLAHKLAAGSKIKFAPVSTKGRQHPTANEAKRIAKIFSSRMK
ncbi:C2 domain-containing protein 3-like isoform X2 [Haliotis rufescens]|uniref:C2 domain-containing protein 3-like isoform X2 n=1 Tax=Haliotis rufescens TaxID=6454 RepID=UPI00201EDB97|nr:C2 domain-containing protein 3-like isoform X2 [Haliotis rufescens]